MAEPVRLALIGCGRIAQVAHLPALEKAEGIELMAVSDLSAAVARSVAGRYGVPAAHTDPSPIWADDAVEAVLITAPDRFHHTLSTQALEAGKHVLVEKPLASTVRDAEDLVALVDRTGLVLQVGAMKRHDQGLQYARAFVGDRLGTARSFNAWYRIGDLRPGIEATLFPPVFAETEARRHEHGKDVPEIFVILVRDRDSEGQKRDEHHGAHHDVRPELAQAHAARDRQREQAPG